MGRAGRRPGQPETREHILAAARKLFAEQGYLGTTVRAIAIEADVNAALLHHYFGNKQQLFVAALQLPFDPAEMIPELIAAAPEEAGERIARLFLDLWSDPERRVPFLAILRSVTSNNDQAIGMLREFMDHTVFATVAKQRGIPRLRVSAAAAQMFGIALLRYVVRVPALAEATDEEIVTLVGPTIQRYLDG